MTSRQSRFSLAAFVSSVVVLLSCALTGQTPAPPPAAATAATVNITVTYNAGTHYCTQTSKPPSASAYLIDVPNNDYVSWVSAAANDPIDVKFAPGSSPFYEANSNYGLKAPKGPVQSGQANGTPGNNYYYQSLMVGAKACANVNGVGSAQQLGIVMRPPTP
jgi:hypothetical protein